MFRGLKEAFADNRATESKLPPIPTPTIMGGQGRTPISDNVCRTNLLTLSLGLSGPKTFKAQHVAGPPPLEVAVNSMMLDPWMRSKWMIGTPSPTFDG